MNKEYRLETLNDQAQNVALWRYGLISELILGCSTGLTMSQRLKQAAQRTWSHPQQGNIRIAADTLRHWIYRYNKTGFTALKNNPRVDKGKSHVPKDLVERFSVMRNENPHATTERILNLLIELKHWNGVKPSRSAFYRLAGNKGLKRKAIHAAKVQEAHAFAYDSFGQMWTADFLHGPKVRVGTQMKKTYLLCIIDDATRYVVYAAFGWSEGTAVLIDALSMACRRFGIPERFYTDNGSAFRSRHLAMVAARLGMHLPHTPAYRPQGRGKIERFFRTVRDQCLAAINDPSMEKLKNGFAEWLDGYHHRIHDGLECSPLNKRLAVPKVTRTLPEVAMIDTFFGMQETRKIQRNGTVHLQGKVFDVKGALPGSLVEVHYLPWDLSVIHVGPERIPAKPIDLIGNARRHEHNPIRGKNLKP